MAKRSATSGEGTSNVPRNALSDGATRCCPTLTGISNSRKARVVALSVAFACATSSSAAPTTTTPKRVRLGFARAASRRRTDSRQRLMSSYPPTTAALPGPIRKVTSSASSGTSSGSLARGTTSHEAALGAIARSASASDACGRIVGRGPPPAKSSTCTASTSSRRMQTLPWSRASLPAYCDSQIDACFGKWPATTSTRVAPAPRARAALGCAGARPSRASRCRSIGVRSVGLSSSLLIGRLHRSRGLRSVRKDRQSHRRAWRREPRRDSLRVHPAARAGAC